MALLALSKGQLLVSIYKMCKEYDMLDMYDKRYLKYDVRELASEYVMIENKAKELKKYNTYNDWSDEGSSDEALMKNPCKISLSSK